MTDAIHFIQNRAFHLVGLATLTASGGPVPPAERVVTITAKDYAFSMPERIPSGRVTLRLHNEGKELHHLFLVKLFEGKSEEDLFRNRMAPWPPTGVGESVSGPNASGPGGVSEAILVLEPGRYVAICVIPSADGKLHLMKGMMRAFLVDGEVKPTADPKPTATIRLNDYDFELPEALAAGPQTIRVENRATQDHEVVLVKLPDGKHAPDFLAWVTSQQGPPPALAIGGVTPLAAGRSVILRYDLTAGTYALYCFVPDRRDGREHTAHGMVREIRVPSRSRQL